MQAGLVPRTMPSKRFDYMYGALKKLSLSERTIKINNGCLSGLSKLPLVILQFLGPEVLLLHLVC
jgi:hypothetical protein